MIDDFPPLSDVDPMFDTYSWNGLKNSSAEFYPCFISIPTLAGSDMFPFFLVSG